MQDNQANNEVQPKVQVIVRMMDNEIINISVIDFSVNEENLVITITQNDVFVINKQAVKSYRLINLGD